jgi:hypothetical protein
MNKLSQVYFPLFALFIVLGASVFFVFTETDVFGGDDDGSGAGGGGEDQVPEDYHAEHDGWAIGTQLSTSEEFPVEEGAMYAFIVLDGDEGFHGMNDLDMSVYGANGVEVGSSAGGGPDERVELDDFEFFRGDTGTYRVEIQNFAGDPAISYHLTIDVYYHELDEEEA